MEFLKAIFGDKSLTYDELSAALANSKDVKLANLAEGKHVDKEKYTALETRNKTLSDQLAQLGDVKPDEMQAEIARLKSENEQFARQFCIHFLRFFIKFHAFLSTFELNSERKKKPTNRIVLRICGLFVMVAGAGFEPTTFGL